ncbi:MAG: ATP-binding protein [Vicinamibacterales bacterium]|mgnify:CR=1 FL=1
MPGLGHIGRTGFVAALLVAASGLLLERARFGASDETAFTRVAAELQQRFDASGDALGAIAAQVAAERDAIRAARPNNADSTRLFDVVDRALPREPVQRTGVTVYDASGAPVAWAGRVSDLPRDRLDGPPRLVVVPAPRGPLLQRLEPIADGDRRPSTRIATIVVEQALGPDQPPSGVGDQFALSTSLVPVTLRVRTGGAPQPQTPFTYVVLSRSGEPMVDAAASQTDLAAARARWRRGTWGAVLLVLAVTLLLSMAPLVEARRQATDARRVLSATGGIVLALVVARVLLWFAAGPLVGSPRVQTSPLDLLLTSLLAAAVGWLAIDLAERLRLARPRPRLLLPTPQSSSLIGSTYFVVGLIDTAILWGYERILQMTVARTSLDPLHFSLHPASAARLGMAFGLLLLHAVVIWAAVASIRLPTLAWRMPRGVTRRVAALAWILGVLVGVSAVGALGPPIAHVPPVPLLIALATAGASAVLIARVGGRARRGSQALRFGAGFLALLVPAAAMYPSLLAYTIQRKEDLIAREYGPQAASAREDLQTRLRDALDQIDGLPMLDDYVAGPSDIDTPPTDRAFVVWSQTDLQKYQLTSAVELYRADGRLVSRFALNLPDAAARYYQTACVDWELSDDISPSGAGERHVVRASRGICAGSRPIGAIVVRAMLDYRALPFIAPTSPYLASLPPERQAPAEGVYGRDVEFAVYGWSRAPIYVFGTSVWPLPDAIFERMTASRAPDWATVDRDGQAFRVHFLNDRGGIYALGYPVITWFGHLVNLAELVILTGVLSLVLIASATIVNALTSRTPASGRALLREIRSSFYRKLFLAFVAVAVTPAVILAVVTRQYFATQFQSGVEEAAARTATVAQRLVEDYATLQERGSAPNDTLDDEIMVLVGRAIQGEVNLFDRSRLQATSERHLFASRLLSVRTPGDVYRKILIDRQPTYVSVQDLGGSYLLAAAPVRGRDGIVTVPVPLQQPEVERQIDELDRRVWFAFVLFSLMGSALGYWMAERIADPVSRLTRATRRIARGDLDARVASTSSDELRRLVEDFNQMAADLQRQRATLERTKRLEAWADMARQVAHDIKNPLTPIQLSAEHARRVNLDRGSPLSPVLDECVAAILTQVALLRQISAEFSSFATSPTPRPEPTAIAALVDEVITPYRMGLSGRIAIETIADDDLPLLPIDRTLLARALTNVIENALHAMPGKGTLTIVSRQSAAGGQQSADHSSQPPAPGLRSSSFGQARQSAEGAEAASPRSVVIEVTDTGIGMDQESLAKIFEPYFSTRAAGTGLGLTIAKRNVDLNGGTITVRSERGVGTTVTITLPA